MKTRKVGRVLSLLLAIAMVVGLMVPVSSVLAEETYTTVTTHAELKKALDDAASKDPNTVTRIKLGENIIVPVAKFLRSGEATFGKTNIGYLATPDLTNPKTQEVNKAIYAEYFDDQGRFVLNRSYRASLNGGDANDGASIKKAEFYHTYDSVVLVVPEGSNVVLDLAGHSIKMHEGDGTGEGYQKREASNDPNPNPTVEYSGTDSYGCITSSGGMSSVITVKGTLTLEDSSGNNSGIISGGTGNIIDSNNVPKVENVEYNYYVNPSAVGGGLMAGQYTSANDYTTGTAGWAGYNSDNCGIANPKKGYVNYTAKVSYYDLGNNKVSKACGGGIYVAPGAKFVMDGGTITENTAWLSPTNRDTMVDKASTIQALGGGVYVSDGAEFTMNGGVIKMNTARAYQKETDTVGAAARGGGVYISENATMNFNGGFIEGNSTYANVSINGKEGISFTEGGGIYVAKNAVLNMFGSGDDELEWPEVIGNYCGGYINPKGTGTTNDLLAQGAGIQIVGTVNMSRAFVRGNSFVPMVAQIKNEDGSYTYGYTGSIEQNNDAKIVDIIQRWTLDDIKTYNLDSKYLYDVKYVDGNGYLGRDSLGNPCSPETIGFVPYEIDDVYTDESGNEIVVSVYTQKEDTATNWVYGLYNGGFNNKDSYISKKRNTCVLYTNGAGINLDYQCDSKDFLATLNIGDRSYIFDNWDSVTNDKYAYSFSNTTIIAPSTTRDNVCLNESKSDSALGSGHYQYIGCAEPATESRIGINTIGTADTWVTVKNANENSLDSNVWGEYANSGYSPTLTDVQFFWDDGLNGEGKNYIANGPEFAVIYESASDSGNYLRPHDGEDVLGFGLKENAYKDENGTYKTYVMLNYDEADLHRYSKLSDGTYSWVESYKEAGTEYWLNKDSNDMFSVELPKPNYKFYKTTDWTTLGGYIDYNDNKRVQYKVGEVGPADSIQRSEDGVEAADLYFKGYQFYSPYGHFEMLDFRNVTKGDADASIAHSFRAGDLFVWNDNPLHISVPAYTAMWYTDEELAEARSRISGVKMQRVILKDGSEALRLLAVVGQQYAEYDSAGFIISTTNATPTVEGGYNYSIKTAIYGKILTKNDSTGNESVYVSSSDIMSEDEFANGKGILYTNLKITDTNKDTVYYVTPYAYVEKTDTYYYGKSRAVSYNYAHQKDVENGISSETE